MSTMRHSNSRPLDDYLVALSPLVRQVIGTPVGVSVSMATADSRDVESGGLFVAIHGAVQDGAAFVADALARGAVAIVSAHPVTLPDDCVNIVVENTYHAAGRIAETAYHHPADSLRLLGITGTNGKTTCAYFLHRILQACGHRTGLVGTVEYDNGAERRLAERTTPTPFDLQRLFCEMTEHDCEFAVVEVSSHALHQRRTGTARFAGAMFTNLTGDHLDYHRDMEAYFSAKSVLFHECLAGDAPALINVDDPFGRRLFDELNARSNVHAIGFGHGETATYRVRAVTTNLQSTEVSLTFPDGATYDLHSALIGDFNVMNLVGTVGLAVEMGVPLPLIQEAIGDFRGAPGRLERFDSPRGFKVFVDYAHTDDALRNVLTTVRSLSPRRLTVVFGCGGDRDRSKRPRMAAVAAALADRVVATSDNPRTEDPDVILDEVLAGVPPSFDHCERIVDRGQAIEHALISSQAGDVVLIAGKGHENYQEIQGIKCPFDDRKEVERVLAQFDSEDDDHDV